MHENQPTKHGHPPKPGNPPYQVQLRVQVKANPCLLLHSLVEAAVMAIHEGIKGCKCMEFLVSDFTPQRNSAVFRLVILLMEEILHQLIGSLSYYFQGFIHPRECRISSINSILTHAWCMFFWRWWWFWWYCWLFWHDLVDVKARNSVKLHSSTF